MAKNITKLQAINIMLGYIGNASINNLQNSGRLGEQALSILELNKTDILQNNWWFNSNTVTLEKDVNNEIYIPNNVIDIIPTSDESTFQQIGNKLFNLSNNSFEFDSNLEVNVIYDLDWDDIPFVMQNYITLGAVKDFFIQRFPKNQIPSHIVEKFYKAENDVERINFNNYSFNLRSNSDITNIINN